MSPIYGGARAVRRTLAVGGLLAALACFDRGEDDDATESAARTPAEAFADTVTPAAQASAVAERLGERLARVSLLAPDSTRRRQIRDEYGSLVTGSLLESWLSDPSGAPGRSESSRWPDRIEVSRVERLPTGAYRVAGDIVYVTSIEPGQGTADREPVVLVVVREPDGHWRVLELERAD